jgi:clan AA aspartic protease
MGLVKVTASIGATNENLSEMEFMVDTGALYTMLPPAVCQDLGIEFRLTERVIAADSRTITIDLGMAHVKVNGREGATLVGKMNLPLPLLGAMALESLGLKVDPVKGILEETRPFPEAPAL